MIVYLVTTTFFISQGLCNVNVALGKTATDCFGNNHPKLIDGRMETSAIVSQECGAKTVVINVNIDGPYFVHYVNLVADDCNGARLVSFKVRKMSGKLCGKYFNDDGKCSTHRVNCIDVNIFTSGIVVELDDHLIRLKEIEVFTLAPGEPFQDIMIYYGCFKDFQSDNDYDIKKLDECVTFCSRNRYLFTAIEGEKCHCGFEVYEDLRVIKARCTDGCYPDDKDCSRDDKYYLVYIIRVQLPYRYSCVEKPPKLTLVFSPDGMSVEICLRHCDDSQFAVLEIFLKSIRCYCDNGTYGKSQIDLLTGCGKTQKNYLIYATCYDGTSEKTKCSNLLMHCKDGWNMYGVCKDGCKKGFDGEQCLERIPISCELCPKGISKCVETRDVFGKNNFICICNAGYIKVNDTVCVNELSSTNKSDTYTMEYTSITASELSLTNISDLNLTKDNEMTRPNDTYTLKYTTTTISEILCSNKKECGTANTKCIVTGSTFKCVCEEGYDRDHLETDCLDIDECSYGPCNLVRSTCQNQEGTFECFCRSGYVQLSQDTCSINTTSSFEQQFDFWFIERALFVILLPLGAIIIMISLGILFKPNQV